uniref:hypothetical protein n=1 Tax=Listeria monocytogenes TaxID=1639 RepID=UPI003132E035
RKLEASLDKERDAYGLLMAAEVDRDDARAAIIQALSCLDDHTRTDAARTEGARLCLRSALSGVRQPPGNWRHRWTRSEMPTAF